MWKIRADGSGKQRLLLGETLKGNWLATFGDLALSHDGQRMAFGQLIEWWRTSIRSTSLWTVSTDGPNVKEWVGQIENDVKPGSAAWSDQDMIAFREKASPMGPAWSPDDASIAFVDFARPSQGLPGAICILDVKSGDWWVVGEGEVFAWSPDGDALAIHSRWFNAVVHDIQIVNLDGETEAVVTLPPSVSLFSLDWSASTGRIVTQAEEREVIHPIFLIDPYTGNRQVVIEDIEGYAGYSPQWSPSGEMILLERLEQGVRNLYVLNVENGELRLLMPQVSLRTVWSPDSKLVLVESEVEGKGLYIVSVSDGQYWKIPNTNEDNEGARFNGYDWLFPPP